MLKKFLLPVLIILLTRSWVNADFPLEEYRKLIRHPQTKEQMSSYIIGLGRGIFWANTVLESEKKISLFCMPRNMALDAGVIESLLDQEIRAPSRRPWSNDTPIELILTASFVDRFPCTK